MQNNQNNLNRGGGQSRRQSLVSPGSFWNRSKDEKSFLFPPHRANSIIDCLEEIGLEDVTREDLFDKNPNKNIVRYVFLELLELLSGKTAKDFEMAPPCPSTSNNNKDGENNNNNNNNDDDDGAPPPVGAVVEEKQYHEGSTFSELYFYLALQELFQVCGYYEFSIKDLVHPHPKRLKEQLSAIINLAKMREEQMTVYIDAYEPRQEKLQELNAASMENQELFVDLQNCEKQYNSAMDNKELLLKDVVEIEKKIAKQNPLQRNIRLKLEDLSKQLSALQDEIDSASWAVQEACGEKDGLLEQVVGTTNIQQIIDNLSQKKQELDARKLASQQLSQQLQDCKLKARNLQIMEQKLEAAVKHIDEYNTQLIDKYRTASEQFQSTTDQVESVTKSNTQMESETNTLQRNLHRINDQLSSERKQHVVQMNALQETITQTKKQMIVVERERRVAALRVNECEDQLRTLQQIMTEEQNVQNSIIAKMTYEYELLQHDYLIETNEPRIQSIQERMNEKEDEDDQ